MNRENRRSTMKREDIEAKIVDAADGRLSEKERLELEEQLRAYPGLLQSYYDIMNLPDLSSAYRGCWQIETTSEFMEFLRILKRRILKREQ